MSKGLGWGIIGTGIVCIILSDKMFITIMGIILILVGIIGLITSPKESQVSKINSPVVKSSEQSLQVNTPNNEKVGSIYKFKIAGMQYYKDEIENIGEYNSIYDLTKKELQEDFDEEKIYEYYFDNKECRLVEEPDNEFDPNAVAVYVRKYKIGYIRKGACSRVKNLLKSQGFEKTEVEIYGGKYKYVSEDGIEKDDDGYRGKVSIYIREVNC